MDRYLLSHIKKLEKDLNEVKEKEDKLKKVVLNIKKLVQPILEIKMINKDIKEKILKYINTLVSNLGIDKPHTIYNKNGYLNKSVFFDLLKNFKWEDELLFIFKLRDSNEVEFASSFIESKFTPYLYIDTNKIIGVINKTQLKEFENTKMIPLFKNGVYQELKFFIIFFEIEGEVDEFQKAINIFDRFYLKPSMSDKSFVHYSLIDNKIIDFELVEKEKIKKEFAYINELKYPEIENIIRKEIKNIRFVLALLDRIDNEIHSIKRSKGTIIVVKRILSFIHKYQLDPQIQEMSELISQELEREEYIR